MFTAINILIKNLIDLKVMIKINLKHKSDPIQYSFYYQKFNNSVSVITICFINHILIYIIHIAKKGESTVELDIH